MHENKYTDILVEAHLTDLVLRQAVIAGLSKDAFRTVNIQNDKLRRMLWGRKLRLALPPGSVSKAERKKIGRESAAITKQLKIVRNVLWQAMVQLQRQQDPSTTNRMNAEQRKGYEGIRAQAIKDISRRTKLRILFHGPLFGE
jgi:hypothetical protein